MLAACMCMHDCLHPNEILPVQEEEEEEEEGGNKERKKRQEHFEQSGRD